MTCPRRRSAPVLEARRADVVRKTRPCSSVSLGGKFLLLSVLCASAVHPPRRNTHSGNRPRVFLPLPGTPEVTAQRWVEGRGRGASGAWRRRSGRSRGCRRKSFRPHAPERATAARLHAHHPSPPPSPRSTGERE